MIWPFLKKQNHATFVITEYGTGVARVADLPGVGAAVLLADVAEAGALAAERVRELLLGLRGHFRRRRRRRESGGESGEEEKDSKAGFPVHAEGYSAFRVRSSRH